MKICFLILFSLPMIVKGQDSGIMFEQELAWPQVLVKAKAENKYVFVDCYATWCGPCKAMDRDIYPSKQVGDTMNAHFISLRVQMDSTDHDEPRVQQWYADARELARKYAIEGYPSFLFFAPDGRIVSEELGYKKMEEFLKMSESARDPQRLTFYTKLAEYKDGKRDYNDLGDLAQFTERVVGDKKLATVMARDYMSNHLNNLKENELATKSNINFMSSFAKLVNSSDAIFRLSYSTPGKIDALKGDSGWARSLVMRTIMREELEQKYDHKSGHAPDWKRIERGIGNKYPQIDVKLVMLNYESRYYKANVHKDWLAWAKVMDEYFRAYPPQKGTAFAAFSLNNPAWEVFENCNDRRVLKMALAWIDLAIKLTDLHPYPQVLDTRANLLYKLGRQDEAVNQELAAIDRLKELARKSGLAESSIDNEFQSTVDKMKMHVPTWSSK